MTRLRILTGAVLLAALAGCGRSETPTTQAARTRPANAADWPAFQGGGPLLGVAPDIGPPPMRVRWTYQTDRQRRPAIANAAAIVGETVYVADADGGVHALDLATGKPRWVVPTDNSFEAAPLVHNGRVLIGDSLGLFYALDAADGHKVWTYDAGSFIHGGANIAGDRIVFGTEGASIICLNLDGKLQWTAPVDDSVYSTPAIREGVLYAAGCGAVLRATALADGRELWQKDLPALTGGSPAVLADRIIVGTDEGHVQCWTRQDPALQWDYTQIQDGAMVLSTPAVALDKEGGTVVVGARDQHLHAIDLATGKRKWAFATQGDVDAAPVISGGRVYVGSADKRFYVLDLQTGHKLWQFLAGKPILVPAAIGGGVVVIGDAGGTVYCLEPQ